MFNLSQLKQRLFMSDNTDQVLSQSRFGRKILQENSSSSSFNTSQPSFIALLCVIAVLTMAIVITIIILCYRYYSHREQTSKTQHKSQNIFRPVLSIQHNQQSNIPVSITPSSISSYSVRSSRQLFSNRHQQQQQPSSVNILPSRPVQPSMIDAYLNDVNAYQPATLDPNQLNSFLFIDLHSTSSETFPETLSKQMINNRNTNNTTTSGYNTLTGGEDQTKFHRRHLFQQQRHRSTLISKRSNGSRFLMRERSLPNNLHELPQLREATTQQQRHLFGKDDTNNSSTITNNQDLLSTDISITTDDYDDSHAYHVHQNQIIRTVKEAKPSNTQHFSPPLPLSPYPLHHQQEPYFFEIVSTDRGDDSIIQIPHRSSPIMGDGIAYINDSIIV